MNPSKSSSRTIARVGLMVICNMATKADALVADQSLYTGKPQFLLGNAKLDKLIQPQMDANEHR